MNSCILRGTDLEVSPICLGTPEYGSSITPADSFRLMDAFVDLGGNFFDTAHVYADWQCNIKGMSERTLGAWAAARKCRDRVILATKGGCFTAEDPVPRLAPEQIIGDLKEGLKRLQTDRVDLYWLHRDDPERRSVAEMMDTLDDLRRQGLIRWYAASNWSPARLWEASEYAADRGIAPFVASQIQWSLATMNPDAISDQTLQHMDENALVYHLETGMPVVPFSPQARGFFSGRYVRDQPESGKSDVRNAYGSEENWGRLERACALAREWGATPNQIALAYLMGFSFQCFPIVGARNPQQLADSCGAAAIVLTPRQMVELEEGDFG